MAAWCSAVVIPQARPPTACILHPTRPDLYVCVAAYFLDTHVLCLTPPHHVGHLRLEAAVDGLDKVRPLQLHGIFVSLSNIIVTSFSNLIR